MNKDQREIYNLQNELRTLPREVKEESEQSEEVDIPTNVQAEIQNNLSPVKKPNKNVKSNKKLDYGERMRNALKQSYN
jgi:hypothetical protein